LDFEKLRWEFRPARIRVLFVGESRPAGGTFFYAGNSLLFSATRKAFMRVYGEATGSFLEFFKQRGCYLTDLCDEPVNKLPSSQRAQSRGRGISTLSRELAAALPQAVVIVMADIVPFVNDAIRETRITGPKPLTRELVFPRTQHRVRYVQVLSEVLREFIDRGILESPRELTDTLAGNRA
jgi:hypothetical protein